MAAARSSNPVRMLITVVMDVLWVWAVVVLAGLVVAFFGFMASASWGKAIVGITKLFVLPLGLPLIHTPYRGVFVLSAAATVLVVLAAEWVLGMVRRTV